MERATPEAEDSLGLIHTIHFGDTRHAPIVYLVHGRAGNVEVMRTFRRCIPDGWTVIAVQAPLADVHDGGWSWWDIHTASLDLKAQFHHAEEVLGTFFTRAQSFYSLEPLHLAAVGFSQGAELVSRLVMVSPTLFQGVALLAGRVSPFRLPLPNGARQLCRILICHGSEDTVISIAEAREGMAFLQSNAFPVQFVEDATGHKVGSKGMTALREFLASL